MNIKIRYTITGILAVAAIVMATLSVPVLQSFGETPPSDAVQPLGDAVSLSEPMPFILREYNGKLAVFTPESGDSPAVVTSIDFNTLREVDRQMLRNGIGVRESSALAALLEDFGP